MVISNPNIALVTLDIHYLRTTQRKITASNTVISPNFLVCKFCGNAVSAEFQVNRPKLCGNCAFPQIFSSQFVLFNQLSYCFKETIGFDKWTFFARPLGSFLIKPGDITKDFQ